MVTYHNGFRMHCTLDIYGDFAMMRSYSFEDYRSRYDASRAQSILQNNGYYYGYGTTKSLGVVVNKSKMEAGVKASVSDESMINSRSRVMDKNPEAADANDTVTTVRTWVAYQLSKALKVEVGVERTRHQSDYRSQTAAKNSAQVSVEDVRKYGRLIYVY